MKVTATAIPEVRIIEPDVFGDARGFFFESFNERKFADALGRDLSIVQDNHSLSAKGVLRGLHYQLPHPQAKLVRVIRGEIWDVAVDLRRGSRTFGRWVADVLSADNKRQLFIPEGFAHGFVVRSPEAEVLYKVNEYWAPEHERCIRWDDPALAIAWPLEGAAPLVSKKDAAGSSFADAIAFEPEKTT